jgi:hypothetical protein
VLDLLACLCARASIQADPTGPALVAMIAQRKPTILVDEADTIWGAHGGASHAVLRAVLNSGYKAGRR